MIGYMTSYILGPEYGYYVDLEEVHRRVKGGSKLQEALEEEVCYSPTCGDLASLIIAYKDWKRACDAR